MEHALARIAETLEGPLDQRRSGADASLEGAATAVGVAGEELERALSRRAPEVSPRRAADCAGSLLCALAYVWAAFGPAAGDRRRALERRLTEVLAGHERSVLAGEAASAVDQAEATRPARAALVALDELRKTADPDVALFELERAVIGLAACLVRVAAERTAVASADGDARWKEHSARAAAAVERAAADERPAAARADPAGLHLSAALRAQLSPEAVQAVESETEDKSLVAESLIALRRSWLGLAAREWALIEALDGDLETPVYARFASLGDAVRQGALNVIRESRLDERPHAFRHAAAWAHQIWALAHSVESYTRALRGEEAAFGRTQLIVLTRLLRATAAIALIDARLDDG